MTLKESITHGPRHVTTNVVNTDPEQWFAGAWQAQASDGWKGPIRSFKWRARIDAALHRL